MPPPAHASTRRTSIRRQSRISPLVVTCWLLGALLALAPRAHAEDVPNTPDPARQASSLVDGLKSKDVQTRVQAATKAKAFQDANLTTPLVRLLSDKERSVREAAIDALAARTEKAARKKAASSLAGRLPRLGKHPADAEELRQVIDALGALEQPTAIKPLLSGIDVDMDLEEVKARIDAVGRIPDKKTIEALIDFLALGRRGGRGKHRSYADKALRYATGAQPQRDNRKAGRDADRWRAWWRENEKTFSFDAIRAEREAAAEAARARAEKKRAQAEKRKKAREKKNKKKSKEGAPPRKKKPRVPD